jgi:hypothetical protein
MREGVHDFQDSLDMTYKDVKHFCKFLDKFSKWNKSHHSKTLIDKISPSDIAYTIIIYKKSKDGWEEELNIKACYRLRKGSRHHIFTNPSIMRDEVNVSSILEMAGHRREGN